MSRPDTLLLVDDNTEILTKLMEIVKPFGYANILTATTFDSAIGTMVAGQRLILDLIMSAGGTEGSQLAKHYIQELDGDARNVAIHSGSFSNNKPYQPEEKWLRAVMGRIVPGVTLIPKFDKLLIAEYLNKD